MAGHGGPTVYSRPIVDVVDSNLSNRDGFDFWNRIRRCKLDVDWIALRGNLSRQWSNPRIGDEDAQNGWTICPTSLTGTHLATSDCE